MWFGRNEFHDIANFTAVSFRQTNWLSVSFLLMFANRLIFGADGVQRQDMSSVMRRSRRSRETHYLKGLDNHVGYCYQVSSLCSFAASIQGTPHCHRSLATRPTWKGENIQTLSPYPLIYRISKAQVSALNRSRLFVELDRPTNIHPLEQVFLLREFYSRAFSQRDGKKVKLEMFECWTNTSAIYAVVEVALKNGSGHYCRSCGWRQDRKHNRPSHREKAEAEEEGPGQNDNRSRLVYSGHVFFVLWMERKRESSSLLIDFLFAQSSLNIFTFVL